MLQLLLENFKNEDKKQAGTDCVKNICELLLSGVGAGVGWGSDLCDFGAIASLWGLNCFIFKVRICIKFLLISECI